MKSPLLISVLFFAGFLFISNNIYSQKDVVFVVNMTKDKLDYYKSRGSKENRDVSAIFSFLREEFNSTVIYSKEQINQVFSSLESSKNVVYVGWENGSFKRDIGAVGSYPMKIVYLFNDNSRLEYECSVNVNGYTYDLERAILRALRKNVNKDEIYERINSIKTNEDVEVLTKEKIDTLESKLVTDNNSIFGVYKLISSTNFSSLSKIGIFEADNEIVMVNLENSAFKNDWKIGQILGKLSKTSSSKYFIGTYQGYIGESVEISIMFNDSILDFTFTKSKESRKFIKIK
jgi:hypothetical protein